jgi:hippurate hydrolase
VRSFSAAHHDRLRIELPALVTSIGAAHGLDVEAEYEVQYPVTVNAPDETDFAMRTARELFGPGHVRVAPQPASGSEDFSMVLQRVPGAMLFVGAAPGGSDAATAPMNHSPEAVFDGGVLHRQAALLAELAAGRLAAGRGGDRSSSDGAAASPIGPSALRPSRSPGAPSA